jgi:hypothetical protein
MNNQNRTQPSGSSSSLAPGLAGGGGEGRGKRQLNSRRFLFCQETSQLTSTRLLSFVTAEAKVNHAVGKTENFLLWKIILQNILVVQQGINLYYVELLLSTVKFCYF